MDVVLPARIPRDKPAIVMARSGEVVTHRDLAIRANRFAHLLVGLGLRTGDAVAVCLENEPAFLYVAVSAMRSGFVFVPVSSRLTAGEIAYIVRDSGARALVASPALEAFEAIAAVLDGGVVLITTGPARPGWHSWPEAADALPGTAVEGAVPGAEMLYSSGTTGRPKGISYRSPGDQTVSLPESVLASFARMGIGGDDIYLCPAPLYHSAPYAWSLAMLRFGGTVVVMERFDPAEALALIERERVTVSQWVPTHFVRMLKLPEAVRAAFNLSSHRLATHAAAPCPVPVKRAMIDWWGPIVVEYFGSSEQSLLTMIGSEEWLAHPGSVGRSSTDAVHICDDHGEPVPAGTIGLIYAEGGADFAYHGDPAKTAAARNARGWSTVGDVGYLDESDYLFVTDRKGFMIISGGVNVYPQEVENLLVTHPRVTDAAVIGLPDADLGERVVAVVQPGAPGDATDAFADELRSWLRDRLSGVKCPKQVFFRSELPRLPTGKMVKHALRDAIIGELAEGTT